MYTEGTFNFARKGSHVFIHLKVPFSGLPRQNLYRLRTFEIPITGKQGLVTQLRTIPNYVTTDNSNGWVGELLDLSWSSVVDSDTIKWSRRTHPSCIFAIQADDSEAVTEYCDFTVRKTVIEPTYFKLAARRYVVTNLTRLHTACGENTFVSDW